MQLNNAFPFDDHHSGEYKLHNFFKYHYNAVNKHHRCELYTVHKFSKFDDDNHLNDHRKALLLRADRKVPA